MKKIYIIITAALTLAGTGCKKFIDINHDPNRPLAVQEKLIVAPIELSIITSLAAGPENVNNATLVNHYMQFLVYNQPVPNFGQYQVTTAMSNASWSTGYSTCLNNLQILTKLSQANGNPNYTALAEILTAYTLATLTDWYGDIPYTKALDPTNLLASYDTQESIYTTVQNLLDAGIADIGKNGVVKPGAEDFFYAGDMTKWKKLAYTLKARYYMHLIKAPGHTAVAQAALALTALQNGMAANTDDLQYTFAGGATTQDTWYQYNLPVTTLCVPTTVVDTLVGRADPRLPQLVAKAINTGLYTGRAIGTTTVGTLKNYSLFGPFYFSVNSVEPILPYTEALFLKAEATLYATGVAAALPIYQSAITANMTKLGVAAGDQATYLTARGSLGTTPAQALERIMQEKKIADFFSIENFNDWRRTGYPKLSPPPNSLLTEVPRIFYYPQSEHDNNPQPQNLANRNLTDRVWWDTK